MPGARQNTSRICGGGGSSSGLLKVATLGALALAAVASASAASGSIAAGASSSSSCASSAAAAAAAQTPQTTLSSNRWVSKALAARGGADEPAEEAPESIPGVMSEVEIALSSFNDIVGENLLVVDNAKKGTTKEVSRFRREGGGMVRSSLGWCVDFHIRAVQEYVHQPPLVAAKR